MLQTWLDQTESIENKKERFQLAWSFQPEGQKKAIKLIIDEVHHGPQEEIDLVKISNLCWKNCGISIMMANGDNKV